MAGSAAPCRAPVAYKPRVCLGRRRRVRRLSDDRFHCCGVLVMESAIIPLESSRNCDRDRVSGSALVSASAFAYYI